MKIHLSLVKVWNDHHSYPANYDMERALKLSMRSIRAQVAYLRNTQPEVRLVHRDRSGRPSILPPAIQKQLDEFRIDTSKIDKAKGLVVTAAQFGATLNKWYWKSLLNYAKHMEYQIVVLPIKYGTINIMESPDTHEEFIASTFPNELKGYLLLDDYDHKYIRLSTARLRPTLQRFLTDSVCSIGGDQALILAAPTIELDFRPRVGKDQPKAIMTTGAVTYPNYSLDKLGQQDRTGLIASKNHCYGAVVIEHDVGCYHFRHVQANKRGMFYDIDLLVNSRSVTKVSGHVEALVCGDYHNGKTDKRVKRVTFKSIVPALRPRKLVLHDFVDGDSISHHGEHEVSRLAHMGAKQWNSLKDELDDVVAELERIHAMLPPTTEIVLVASNHNEFVQEYINSMRWTKDQTNLKIGATLFSMMVNSIPESSPKVDARAVDPTILWIREHAPFVKCLGRKDSYLFRDIILSMHGDIGSKGQRATSLKSFGVMNFRVVIGHTHTAGILGGGLWKVGTMTPRMQFYVNGPATTWTNTDAIVYKNGQIQLVNIIKGKWRLS